MLLKYETLESHLDQELAPLYILTGDEPLLLLESADQIRQAARRQHVIEREVMTVERGFKWGQLHAANNAMSLFGDRKFIELRIPGGKPGKEGSQALQEYVAARHTDNITLITLPRLDMATRKSAWVTALQKTASISKFRPSIFHALETGSLHDSKNSTRVPVGNASIF